MAIATAPLKLSAESTIETTIELRWSPPESDGGDAITGYFIERSLNGAGFVTLIADTGNDNTSFTDTTLSARDNGKYRVSAINISGTGPTSNEASATTSTSEAQTIKELLFNNWSLTGELSKTVTSNMTEVVNFINRDQVPGNKKAKMVTVQKVNELGNENLIEHPRFFEQSDLFEITCFLQVPDSADDRFSVWIDLMQQMASEVIRILKLQFSPSTGTGEFFRTITNWTRDNTFFPDEPMLVRTLRFSLNKLVATDDEVFLGYPDGLENSGVLIFDTLSQGDILPLVDYSYEQVTEIQLEEGWDQIPLYTSDQSKGVGVPLYTRGAFSGTFSALMYAKKSDILGATTEKLQNIYKPQTVSSIINQTAEVILLQRNVNTQPFGSVSIINVVDGGSGFTSAPSVFITGGGGSGATAFSTIFNGSVVGVTVTDGGSGYTSEPLVTISGSPGSGATATAGIEEVILKVTSFMKINRINKVSETEKLLIYRISGILTRPSEYEGSS